MKPYIVGIWKNDPCKVPQGYEFNTWGEALDFYKRNRKEFAIWYHFLMPDVLPFQNEVLYMRVITKTDWNCQWIHVYDYTLDDIRELQKSRVAVIWHISHVLHAMEIR